MCATSYHRFLSMPGACCMGMGSRSSITSEGWVGDWAAKKKSGPRLETAVPAMSSLGSKVAKIASCRPGLLDCARAISCGVVSFWAESMGRVVRRRSSASLFIDCLIYSTVTGVLALVVFRHCRDETASRMGHPDLWLEIGRQRRARICVVRLWTAGLRFWTGWVGFRIGMVW